MNRKISPKQTKTNMCKQTKMESLRGRIRICTGEEISPLLRSVVVVGEDDLTGSIDNA